jgi:hypothetical protein
MIDSVQYSPVTQTEWWNAHVEYAKFNRQGVDVLTARFVHPTPRAAVVVLTGWSETFLKYSDFINSGRQPSSSGYVPPPVPVTSPPA